MKLYYLIYKYDVASELQTRMITGSKDEY